MQRRTAIVLAAVALCVTIGVLVGLVLRLGDGDPAAAASPSSGALSSSGPAGSAAAGITVLAPPLTSADGAPTSPESSAPAAIAESTVTVTSTPPTTAPTSPAPAGIATTTTARPRIAPATTSKTTSSSTTTSTTTTSKSTVSTTSTTSTSTASQTTTSKITVSTPSSRTSTSAPTGSPVANGACAPLGTKAADRPTLFCQHDQQSGALRWRAVVAGGGCLNRTMIGTDSAGVGYRCRADRAGINHWVKG